VKRVTGIGGIFFKAKDAEKLKEWYRDHLGIDCHGGAGAAFEWREPEHPERSGLTVWSVFPAHTKYFEPSAAPFMINYRVADLDRLLAQLREEGVEVEGRIEEDENGRFAWASDPEGNRFELWEPSQGK
jgi:predicted enzyme related to lactoylglutathione lyase